MARYTFKMQRLFVSGPLIDGEEITLDKACSNYLVNVLRMKVGEALLVFNGRGGEFHAEIAQAVKKAVVLSVIKQTRVQTPPGNIDYCFAPLKQARLDYMMQKATEMGAARLRPVITAHTQVTRLNLDRVRANVIEAAEQCGILSVPEVMEPVKLSALLADWETEKPERSLIFCDEATENDDPVSLLKKIAATHHAVLIGPEGGFSDEERDALLCCDFVHTIPLGPRILRADTAAVAALAVIQATLGDWTFNRTESLN